MNDDVSYEPPAVDELTAIRRRRGRERVRKIREELAVAEPLKETKNGNEI